MCLRDVGEVRLLRDYGAPPRADRWTRFAARGWRRSLTRLAMASPGIVDDGSPAAFRTIQGEAMFDGERMHPNTTDPMQLSADQVSTIPVPPHLRGYELENGELVAVSLPAPLHGRLVAEVLFRIKLHLRDNPGLGRAYGEVGYVLGLANDPERLRGPDVSFVSQQRIRSAGGEPEHGWFRLVPDLVVEIDSPGRRPPIEQRRIQDYMEAGVGLIWVIHAATRSATVYRADGGVRRVVEDGVLDGGDALPGLRVSLASLFLSD
jgi:Uma2 family endonuclease